ncbi:unnamed protein product [Mytilus edulis]|uniref:Ig-like domain-containing protein n=1 Tax=Mytilus edulis TaxID=6550 RepID=A0A8S3TGI4_MYTED|nr:unnamed protein product [Mytilus edulis]
MDKRSSVKLKMYCKNGIPAATLIWSKEGLTVSNGSSDTLTYQLTPTRFDHMQNITCYINSDLLKSPLSQTVYLDIQYRPQLKIIRSKNKPIIEGESLKLCCFSTSNPPAHCMAWYQNNYKVYSWNHNPSSKFEGLNTEICLRIIQHIENSTGNYVCFAENTIAKSNSRNNPPDVKVTYKISEQRISLHCIPNGKPENYTFYDWQHKSEFNEHIRYIHGTREGKLIIQTHQSKTTNEVDGIYVCNVSNGVPNLDGNVSQEGQTGIKYRGTNVTIKTNLPPIAVRVNFSFKYRTLELLHYDEINQEITNNDKDSVKITGCLETQLVVIGVPLKIACTSLLNFKPKIRRSEEELDYPIASSSHDNQLYQMQIQDYNENGEDERASSRTSVKEREFQDFAHSIVGEKYACKRRRITEADLNYADIVFEDRHLPSSVIIHGIDNKTIYTDIIVGTQPQNQLSTIDSSSESEDDFIYVDGIENYTERRKMNASQT